MTWFSINAVLENGNKLREDYKKLNLNFPNVDFFLIQSKKLGQ